MARQNLADGCAESRETVTRWTRNIWQDILRNASLVLTTLLRQLLTLLFHRVANRVANFVASDVASHHYHLYCEAGANHAANHAANRKKLASMVALPACRSGVRTFVAACSWRTSLACFVGTLAAVPGCNGDAGASPDCFPGCVSSLAISISGWPRILPVRLESSLLPWRCAVRVNDMENLLLVAA